MFYKTVTLFLLAVNLLFSEYPVNPHVDPATWNSVKPYFLPEDHPVKSQLDRIFSKTRVTENLKSVEKAGFKKPHHRACSHMIISTHKRLNGVIVKMFTDDQDCGDWKLLVRRIQGAELTRETIQRLGYRKYFKVPRKWIYPLPAEPSPNAAKNRQNFILIAEDMDLMSTSANRKQWKGPYMTSDRLKAIHEIIEAVGLSDSVLPCNLPFTYDGKQAFIDTEYFHCWPVPYHKMIHYLSRKQAEYLEELLKK